ncbi:exosortase/archaeosortase family protein [Paludisphaera sp.]|uniref:exosortase/archaeosortase family protein n=1 Tax=Paludisphaera sp. TaxID=2017432 RepID=UPI00301D8B99
MTHTDDRPSPPPEPALHKALARWAADPANRPTALAATACVALLALLFRDTLEHFYRAWTTEDNYSHGFLVPLLSLYFAAQIFRREGAPAEPSPGARGVLLGATLLTAALGVNLLKVPLPIEFLSDLAFLAALAGSFAIVVGAAALRRYWFPFAFLIFMVPLPIALYTRIASPLQLMASRLASAFMNSTGVPVLCEGNRMTLPGGVQMFVAEACSGMRQLTGFLALAAAVAYLARRPLWYRGVVLASALPIALFANTTRVVVTGYIMHFVDPSYAEGAYHTLEGLLLMGMGLVLLSSVCSLMDLISPPDAGPPSGPGDGDGDEPAAAPRPAAGRPALAANGWSLPLRSASPAEELS